MAWYDAVVDTVKDTATSLLGGGSSGPSFDDASTGKFTGGTQTSSSGGGSSIFDILGGLYDDAVGGITGAFTDSKGDIDVGKIIGAGGALGSYLGLFDTPQRPVGYQGGIPDYTATRLQVPNTYDPERRPGSGGQRYFTDVSFSGADLQAEADRLEALNKANIASRTRAGVQMPDVYAARQAAAEAAAQAAAGEAAKTRVIRRSGAPPADNPNTPQNERQDFLDRVAAGETSDVLTGIPPGFNPNSVTPFTNLPRPGGVGAAPADVPRTPQNEYQDFLDKLASGEITGGGPFGPKKPLVGNLQGSGVATSNNPAAAQSFNQLGPTAQAALLSGAMKGFARGGIAQFSEGNSVEENFGPDAVRRVLSDGRVGIFTDRGRKLIKILPAEDASVMDKIKAQASPIMDALDKINPFEEGGIAQLKKPQYLDGDTDGMADRIDASIEGEQPAALSDGEFVIPADVVSHLGNGNSEAGAKVLEKMMARVRKERTGSTKQGKEIVPEEFLPA